MLKINDNVNVILSVQRIIQFTLQIFFYPSILQLHSDASTRALTFVLEAPWGRSVLSPVVHAVSLCTRFQSACPLCSVQSLSSSVKVCCLNVSGCQFHFKISHLFFPRFLKRYDAEVSKPLVGRQGSRVSMRVARASGSLLSSHGRVPGTSPG